jgi:hypothetical protein
MVSPALTPITDITFSYGKLLHVFFLYVPRIVKPSVVFQLKLQQKMYLAVIRVCREVEM